MKAKAARNKAYRPRPVRATAALALLGRRADIELEVPVSDLHQTNLGLAYRLAFDQLCTGQGEELHWCTVVTALNVGVILAERGYGPEEQPTFNTALEGAFRARIRVARGHRWGFDGSAMTAIKVALDVHDQQVAAVTQLEMRDALFEVNRRIDAGIVYQEAK